MKHRTVPTTLLLTGALLTAAVPTGAQAAEDTAPELRAWTSDAFPDGNAALADAARTGGALWAVGGRQTGQGRGATVSPVAFTRDVLDRSWHELALPAGLSATTVDADGAGGAWVTGDRSPVGGGIPTGHYAAGRWQPQQAPLPEHVLAAGFRGLAAAGGPDDVWAAGYYQPDDYLTFYGLIEHWDGSSWQQVPTPVLDTDYWTLADVVATGPDDVWAAGAIGTPEGWTRPLLLHYDGRAWNRVAAPDLDSRYGEFSKLVAVGPDDVWAAGYQNRGPSRDTDALVAHFDGRQWTHQDTGLGAGKLTGLTRTPDGVAVVGYAPGTADRPIGARLTRSGWRPLDIPQGTAPAGRVPRAVVSTGSRLTVLGLDLAGHDANGEPLPPQPFSLSR